MVLISTSVAYAESKYDISELYSVTQPPFGTKAIGSYDRTVEIKYILTPTKMEVGKYAVEVKRIGDNLYQIRDTDICVQTRYCREWFSYYKKVLLIIQSNYGYIKGKLIFE